VVALKAIEDVKSGKIAPVFLLSGEEQYLINQAVDYFKVYVLNNSTFDLESLSAEDVTYELLVDKLKTPPFSARKRLIVVGAADKLAEGVWELIEKHAETADSCSCLLLIASSFDKRRRAIAKIGRLGCHFEAPRLRTEQIDGWIEKEIKKYNKKISAEARQLLISACENNLTKISAELDKLSLFVGDREGIETGDIFEIVESSHYALVVFNLNKHISHRQLSPALKLLRMLLYYDEPVAKLLSIMGQHIRKLLQAVEMGRSVSKTNLASRLGVPPFYIDEYLQGAKNYRREKLRAALHDLVNLDYWSKVGRVELKDGLLLWLAGLLSTPNHISREYSTN
jgi:DNA polymerase-3 subunit delta